jgi:hypothetical protein
MPTMTKEARVSAKEARAIERQRVLDERKAKKLHNIAERRARAHKMTKQDYIAAIVKGRFPPITAADLAAEPNPD